MTKRTRIGVIREFVAAVGADVTHYYACGTGSMGGYNHDSIHAGKVLYKVVTTPLSAESKNVLLSAINLIKDTLGVDKVYYCKNGHLKLRYMQTAKKARQDYNEL